MEKKVEGHEEYTKPELREYGDLRELTAGNQSGTSHRHGDGHAGSVRLQRPDPVTDSSPFGGRLEVVGRRSAVLLFAGAQVR